MVGKAAKKKKAPKHINYNWSGYDAMHPRGSRRAVLHVQLALTGPAPAWATGNHKIGPRSRRPARTRSSRRAAAQHFRGQRRPLQHLERAELPCAGSRR